MGTIQSSRDLTQPVRTGDFEELTKEPDRKDLIIARGVLGDVLSMLEAENIGPVEQNSENYFFNGLFVPRENTDPRYPLFLDNDIVDAVSGDSDARIRRNSAESFSKSVKIPTIKGEGRLEKYMTIAVTDYNPVYSPLVTETGYRRKQEISRYDERKQIDVPISAFDEEVKLTKLESISIKFDDYKWVYRKCLDRTNNPLVTSTILKWSDQDQRWKALEDNLVLENFTIVRFDKFRESLEQKLFPKKH
ncbi:MAG: hypothetical protein PHP08_02695 [Candidatus Dojkabacteria bacterium]|nr:hypothetical protein [Candidatus Dojkabacteria bacterium]